MSCLIVDELDGKLKSVTPCDLLHHIPAQADGVTIIGTSLWRRTGNGKDILLDCKIRRVGQG